MQMALAKNIDIRVGTTHVVFENKYLRPRYDAIPVLLKPRGHRGRSSRILQARPCVIVDCLIQRKQRGSGQSPNGYINPLYSNKLRL